MWLTQKYVHWNFSNSCRTAFNCLKEEFTHTPILTHWVLYSYMVVKTNTSDYALATSILSIYTSDGEIHPILFHSHSFNSAEMNYDMHDKELLTIFKAFKHWHQYLEGSAIPVDVVTDHKNLKYFATTKLLMQCQAWWSEYLSQFNMVIYFCPGRLGAKPDTLTRQWDVYHKGGNSDFAMANLSNMRPIFTNEQLTSSLQATYFATPILQSAIIMDVEQLHNTIQESYSLDPITTVQFPCTSDSKWTIDGSGLLCCNDCIYVPDANDLQLKVLQYKHNYILSGHLGHSN